MYTVVMPRQENSKSIRLPLEGDRLKRWEDMLDARKISQQQAVYSLIDWIVQQPPMVQSMVLGQIPPDAGLVEHVLRALPKHKGGVTFTNRGGKLPVASSGSPARRE